MKLSAKLGVSTGELKNMSPQVTNNIIVIGIYM